MPSGKHKARKSKTPLSSLTVQIVSAETRERLVAVGLSAFLGTESEALALLALHSEDDNLSEYAPVCFQAEYDPDRELCRGCVFSQHCWTQDNVYLAKLRKGKAKSPYGVPAEVVGRLIEVPTRLTRKAPPAVVKKSGE